ncbi:hypothetical protein ACH3VR_23000 [Microbacterium sp. B2969]|uniref:Uncharacterized protein n=1 Tax=Microbacterium alkaliflavum TaxID=3248839 RepID=A0ABW7QEB5_9MICO
MSDDDPRGENGPMRFEVDHHSRTQASRGRFVTVLIVSVSAVLAGCSTSPPPAATPAIEPAAPSPSPSSVERPDVPAPPEQLTFDAGADLDPQVWLAGWHVEPIDMTNGYAVVYPRDDWEEKHLSDGCEASRSHRFSLDGLDLSLDDRTLSDQLLAQIVEIPVADISENGSDVPFPVVGRWPTTADFRVRAGDLSNGGAWLAAVRVFGALGSALIVQLECEPGSMTGATGQQMFDLLPQVAGADALEVGLGRVDWNIVEALAFDDGADLVESSNARWIDAALMQDAAWTFHEGESSGSWSFASADGDCTALYVQSRLGEDVYASGDREASDELLESSLDGTNSFAAENVVDGSFALAMPGNDFVATRLIEGSDAGVRWVTAARAFTGPRLGFLITVTCTTGDPLEVLEAVVAESAVQVVP